MVGLHPFQTPTNLTRQQKYVAIGGSLRIGKYQAALYRVYLYTLYPYICLQPANSICNGSLFLIPSTSNEMKLSTSLTRWGSPIVNVINLDVQILHQ